MATSGKDRQAAWRERRREAGLTIHPERLRPGFRRTDIKGPKRWLFIDTEGANDPKGVYGDPGRQWTFLITAADSEGNEWYMYRGRPLTTSDMLWFIIRLPRRGYKFGGYFFQYDLDQMFSGLPEDKLRRLYGTVTERGLPVLHDVFLLSRFNTQATIILPKYQMQEPPDDIQRLPGPRRVIWDVGKFYQAKLTTAIDNWQVASQEEADFVARYKDVRQSFDLDYWNQNSRELIIYSLIENRLAARLQEKFDRTSADAGYPLTSWYGAGSMAKAMMRRHGIKDHLSARRPFKRYRREEDDFALQLPATYYGGRFEILRPGVFDPVYEYDIRSAYPASYRFLPCLVHGQWSLRKTPGEIINPHDLYVVSWTLKDSDVWGPFPYRRKERICYPAYGDQHMVWGEELIAALRIWPRAAKHGDYGICVFSSWHYRTQCDCHPFDWIDSVYQRRKRLGKDSAGYPLKLGMNAIYGSLASTLGSEFDGHQLDGWCEPRWAALITAWTRARLLDALYLAGGARADHVLMFATDAIYSTKPIALDLTDVLGGWESHTYERGGLIIQPGLYHLRGQDLTTKLKGRGIEFRDIQERIGLMYKAFYQRGARARVTIPLRPRYLGTRLMLHRNNIKGAYRWEALERELSFDPSTKRERRNGAWMPRSRESFGPWDLDDVTGNRHRRMDTLMREEVYEADEAEVELRVAEMTNDAQPLGPYAM